MEKSYCSLQRLETATFVSIVDLIHNFFNHNTLPKSPISQNDHTTHATYRPHQQTITSATTHTNKTTTFLSHYLSTTAQHHWIKGSICYLNPFFCLKYFSLPTNSIFVVSMVSFQQRMFEHSGGTLLHMRKVIVKFIRYSIKLL